jgi:predicted ABC-type ATPase
MFAGPNGAGKSTFYKNADFLRGQQPFWIVNPDILTSEIAEREGRAWLQAVALQSPELHIQRVKKRVAEGGHDVDETKIVARRVRSFDNLQRVFPKASFAQVWDNSGHEPRLLFEKHGDVTEMFDPDAIPELTQRIRAATT